MKGRSRRKEHKKYKLSSSTQKDSKGSKTYKCIDWSLKEEPCYIALKMENNSAMRTACVCTCAYIKSQPSVYYFLNLQASSVCKETLMTSKNYTFYMILEYYYVQWRRVNPLLLSLCLIFYDGEVKKGFKWNKEKEIKSQRQTWRICTTLLLSTKCLLILYFIEKM